MGEFISFLGIGLVIITTIMGIKKVSKSNTSGKPIPHYLVTNPLRIEPLLYILGFVLALLGLII
jgi:hypothetical protein